MSNSETGKPRRLRLNKTAVAVIAIVLAAVLTLSIALPLALRRSPGVTVFSAPPNRLPTEEKYALNKYAYDSLDDARVTLRADTMNVTERGLPRAQPEILSDTYKLGDQSITFRDYPFPGHAGGGKGSASVFENNPAFVAEALAEAEKHGMNTDTADGLTAAKKKYYALYKYMLMAQGYNLTMEAQYRSKNGTLTQEWLKKHPAADAQYGAVEGTDNAVRKEIVLDTIYRAYHPTGLYLPAGELVEVKVEGLEAGESISMFIGLQNSLAWRGSVAGADAQNALQELGITSAPANPWGKDAFFLYADEIVGGGKFYDCCNNNGTTELLQSQWLNQHNRLPWVTAEFTFSENKTYYIGTPFGGIMHLNPKNCYSPVKTTITGAVETPHYILGVTTPAYFDEYLRDAPGVYGVIETENGQLVGESKYIRTIPTDEVDKLAMLWHSFFAVNESFTGGAYNRGNVVMFETHVPAGAAVALGNYTYACPSDWYADVTNYRKLLRSGSWGILHEVGHSHHTAYGQVWGFGGGQEGEVRNNALTTLAYILFCDIGTTRNETGGISAEHGFVAHPYSNLQYALSFGAQIEKTDPTGRDFDNYGLFGYFGTLSMYVNLMHSFGAEKFYELLYTYKEVANYITDTAAAVTEALKADKTTILNADDKVQKQIKRADFTYRCSLIFGMDFREYFNEMYCANIVDAAFTAEQLDFIRSLPRYAPVANLYAGGIDGVKTGGDYCITYGENVLFDLVGKTISNKPFTILSVAQPAHGSLTDAGEGKWSYSFNPEYAGTADSFRFRVQMADGTVHELTVYLRISYNGARVSAYKNIEARNGNANELWTAVESEIAGRQPDAVVSVNTGGIPAYTTAGGAYEVRVAEFLWRAPTSGEYQLSAACDDRVRVYFGESFGAMGEPVLQLSTYQGYGATQPIVVEAGKYYAFKLVNLNTGGGGSASIAFKNADGTYTLPALQNVYHPASDLSATFTGYVYEPQYLISKKDNVKLAQTGTDKNEWRVVSAPLNIQDGRTFTETRVDFVTDDNGNTIRVESQVDVDKWNWLIDEKLDNVFHTTWRVTRPNDPNDRIKPPSDADPDVFVIDTNRIQSFNYFTVHTRSNPRDNAMILKYELQISDDNATYRTIATGEKLEYKGTTATLSFPQTQGRYLKLLVKSTTGKSYTIISELDAGIVSKTQKIVSPTSSKLYATKGWHNSSTVAAEPNGYMVAEKKNEKLVARFHGTQLAVYAASGANYGSVKIRLDGKTVQTISLRSAKSEARKLVFYVENLSDKEHTVEFITQSSEKVMINLLGLSYTADLVNAPNIYLEHALTVSLIVFIVLFAVLLALVLMLVFWPRFRRIVLGNRLVRALDDWQAARKTAKKAAKESADTETAATSNKQSAPDKDAQLWTVEEQPLPVPETDNTPPTAKPAAKSTGASDKRTASAKSAAKPTVAPVKAADKPASPVKTAAKPAATAPKTPAKPTPASTRSAVKPADKKTNK